MRVVVPARETQAAIRVPQRAVQELQGKQSVLVVGPENKVAPRDIVARTRVGGDWLVENGLQPGELVVVDGIQKARPGTAVKPVMVASDGGAAPPAASAAAGVKADSGTGAK